MDNPGGQSSSDDVRHGAPKTKNLYDVLGLTKAATDDDIKKAYRRLALMYHPDKNLENDPAKTEKFKEVNHAHTILSNKQKRQIYDTYGMMGLKMMEQIGEEKMTCIAKPWVKWAVCIFGIVTCGFFCCFCGLFCCCQCCCGFCCGKCRPAGMTGDQSEQYTYVYESFGCTQNQTSGPKEEPKENNDPSPV